MIEINRIYQGDNKIKLREMLESGFENRVHLVCTDPKYNIGVKYDGTRDDLSIPDYLEYCRGWVVPGARLIEPGGWFVVVINEENAHRLRFLLEEVNLEWRNTVIWRYSFGVHCESKFSRCHAQILFYAKPGAPPKWRGDRLKVASYRLQHGDKRAVEGGKIMPDVWDIPLDDARDNPTSDVWNISRVCGTFKERVPNSPNQLPEELCRRIIVATTDPGDVGVDPHCGSGTFPTLLKREGRKFVAFDISQERVDVATKRVESTNKRIETKSLASFGGKRDG